MKRTTLFCLLLAVLNGCVVESRYHADSPLCYDLEPGRRLSRGELRDLEHALQHRLLVDFNDDLSFDNPIGPGRCFGEWHQGEWEIDCARDHVVVNCSDP